MSKKFIVPAVLSTALLASLVPANESFAKSDGSKALTKLEKVQNKQEAKNTLKNLPGSKEVKKTYKQYDVVSVEQDDLGFTHYTLKPKVNGKVGLNTEVKVHVNKEGQVTFVNGDLDQKELAPTNTQKLTAEQAVDKAYAAAGVDKDAVKNQGRKVVKKADLVVNPEHNKLVYDVQLIYLTPQPANWKVQIDAETGEVVAKQNALTDVGPTTGSGTGNKGDTKTLNIYEENGTYYLADMTHTGNIETYDAKNATSNYSIVTDSDKYFTSPAQRAAVDAHYYADQVYDYYKNVHNRDSYDNQGAPIYSIVHYSTNYNNAFWNGESMVYGDGDGVTFSPLSGANDVIAHELTHAVTEKTAGLVYENQPGALNESFSDVFGYFVDPDFLMGEDVYTPNKSGDALRSMSNPDLYGQPSHMNNYKYLPNTKAGDWGGVHTNSGIPNKAFYNTVTKLGKAKSEKIYYRALVYYLTPNSSFADAKASLVRAATDLYGTTDASTVANAWSQVGVN
ncbi:M4 family metallopeptidase [Macrococcus equipercicus]|uniref:Neutral metalloproteinase n=1 Tax=Macrococcus equipercicus TaxID=69967 RepID=A0A9Q9BKW0_9STAP|nr:M4 family metallopeptidase [Macrococcus equipercicus]KAA1036609.1 peptidase M4 family protein [Macrococcus equipercicus]UTH13458.1 peptidase M4 family protein [Macrococcus equipercicus]